MLSFIVSLASGVFGWLGQVLPTSPFSGLSLSLSGFGNVLGWLNWIVPVGQMAVMYGVWLAGCAIWQVVSYVLKRLDGFTSVFGALTGK